MDNKNKELDRLNGVYKKILDGAGVEYHEGRGTIVDPHTIDVDGKRFTVRCCWVQGLGHHCERKSCHAPPPGIVGDLPAVAVDGKSFAVRSGPFGISRYCGASGHQNARQGPQGTSRAQ